MTVLRFIRLWRILSIFGSANTIQAAYYDNAKLLRTSHLSSIDHVVKPSETVEIRVGFSLLSITGVVSEDSTFSVVGWFTITWCDSQLTWESTSGSFAGVTSIHYKEGEIWRPELRIENSVADVDIIANEHHKYLVRNGTVIWTPAKHVMVHCAQDLTYFPFDKQKCHMILSSWSHDANEVVVTAIRTDVDLSHYEENAEWKLCKTDVGSRNETITSGGDTVLSSRITFSFTLERVSSLLGLTLLFPMVLLSILSTLVFALSIESGEKVTYSAVLFLSMTVYFTSAVGYFPNSKHIPVRVSYMIVVLLKSCLSLVCTFLALWLYHQKAERHMASRLIQISNFLGLITCNNGQIEIDHVSKQGENIPDTPQASTELPKQLTPIQNGGTHLAAPSLDTMDKLPPVNDHFRKNRIRPKSGESVYSTSKKKVKISTPRNNWQHFAYNLDRFFFILFVIATTLVHLGFLVSLGAGGSSEEA